MTKKGKSSSSQSSNPSDFFSDISDDLQLQVESLSGTSKAASESDNAPNPNEEQPSALFSVPEDQQSAMPQEGEADLFDTAPAGPPATDTSLTDAVPYPAALSDVALESTAGQGHVTTSSTETSAPEEDTTPADNEQRANAESHEPTNADDTKAMAEQPPQEEKEVTASQEENAAETASEEVNAAEAQSAADETAETSDNSDESTGDDDSTSDAAVEAKTEEEAPADAASEDDAQASADEAADAAAHEALDAADGEDADDAEATAEAAEEAAEAVAEEAAEEAAQAAADEAADAAAHEALDADDEGEEPTADAADAGVKVQQGTRKEGESVQLEQKPFRSSAPGTEIASEDQTFVLVDALEHAPDRAVWQAKVEGDDTMYQVREVSATRYRTGYKHFPEIPELALHEPVAVVEEEERAFLIFEQPQGTLLQAQLRTPDHHWTIGQLRRFLRQLAESVHAIHEMGYLLLEINEQHIWLDDNRAPMLYDIERLYTDRTPFHLRPIFEGFSAPELYHQQPIGPHTDVFSLGVLLHYMISQCRAFNHLDLPNPIIPSPRVYQLDFPVGLDHVIEHATHLDPNRRYPDVPSFLQAVERAFHEIEERHRQQYTPLQLAVGHDIHIGINKGMRNPVNQDALFWRYDRRHHKGLFLIADGVSHCHYGSGDRASSILIQAARQCWDALLDSPIMSTPTDHKQRRQILNSLFESANTAIASEVNELYDQVEGYVEDVMGSTCVGGFLDGNQLTVTNLGDSRAYLKTEHYIEQISVDHDYKTAQLQIGQDVRSLQSLMGGSLITRCVGSCRKDDDLKVIPLQLQADFFDLTLLPGDTIVFCSDGLSDYAGESEEEAREMISKIVEVHTEPLSACFWLVALANQRGGGDNISVIELKVLNTL